MDSGTIGLLVAIVGVATIVSRTIEKMVSHLIEESRNKKQRQKDGGTADIKIIRTGNTTDLALQKAAIQDIREDVEKLESLSQHIGTAVEKDLPHLIAQIRTKQDQVHDDVRELKGTMDRLRSALEGNTAATRALYELLASQLKSGR